MTSKKHDLPTGSTPPCTPAQPNPFTIDTRQFPYLRANKFLIKHDLKAQKNIQFMKPTYKNSLN